jgi:hypothetical protein
MPAEGAAKAEITAKVSTEQFQQLIDEVKDARLLLDYAVSVGTAVDDRLVAGITTAEALLQSGQLPIATARAAFEGIYRDLAKVMTPVTAVTLRATS